MVLHVETGLRRQYTTLSAELKTLTGLARVATRQQMGKRRPDISTNAIPA
jgi:hypothetical protein